MQLCVCWGMFPEELIGKPFIDLVVDEERSMQVEFFRLHGTLFVDDEVNKRFADQLLARISRHAYNGIVHLGCFEFTVKEPYSFKRRFNDAPEFLFVFLQRLFPYLSLGDVEHAADNFQTVTPVHRDNYLRKMEHATDEPSLFLSVIS